MKRTLFISDRYFTIFDTVTSHGQLLLRSQKGDNEDTNIDIVFYGTTFLQSSFFLKSVTIGVLLDRDCPFPHLLENIGENNSNKIFEMGSLNGTCYIVASFFKVFKNKLEFHESSLGYSVDRGIEIFSSI